MAGQVSSLFLFSLIFCGFAYIFIKNTHSLLELAWIKPSWKKNKYIIISLKFIGFWFVIIIVSMWLSVLFTIF